MNDKNKLITVLDFNKKPLLFKSMFRIKVKNKIDDDFFNKEHTIVFMDDFLNIIREKCGVLNVNYKQLNSSSTFLLKDVKEFLFKSSIHYDYDCSILQNMFAYANNKKYITIKCKFVKRPKCYHTDYEPSDFIEKDIIAHNYTLVTYYELDKQISSYIELLYVQRMKNFISEMFDNVSDSDLDFDGYVNAKSKELLGSDLEGFLDSINKETKLKIKNRLTK